MFLSNGGYISYISQLIRVLFVLICRVSSHVTDFYTQNSNILTEH